MNEPRKEVENESPDETVEESIEESIEESMNEETGTEEGAPEEEPPVEELSPEEQLRSERDTFESKWLRVVAEMDNVRKRNRRELADTRRFAQADVLRSFLEVMDNFDRAMLSRGEAQEAEAGDAFREGVDLIHQNFRRVFQDKGVETIVAIDAEFDPNVHEAISQMPREGVEPGFVIEVVNEGYTFGDMVLRPARVIISS
jgi:molecular chaperone GrpE